MRLRLFPLLVILSVIAAACLPQSPGTETPTFTPPPVVTDTPPPVDTPTLVPSPTATPEPSPAATDTAAPEPSPTATAVAPTPERPEESILILEPASGSRLSSPIRVAGISDPTFEQNLVIRVVQDDGTELALVPTTIQAEIGQRGPFEAEVPVDLAEERNIFIQVYATSARDGGTTHLSSVGVTFVPGGPEDIQTRTPHPEQIAIFVPQLSDTISGGVAHVEGFALASFEQTLLVEVQDVDGNVIGSQPVIVQAPDLGQPGPFSADVPYTLSAAGPGRIVVRDISPAFGGDTHLSSVEVNLEP